MSEEVLNNELRELFKKWRTDNYYPKVKEVAPVIGLNYEHFTKWLAGKIDYSKKSLFKIMSFLESKNYVLDVYY
ncbi:hypothetical protein [Enterococcus casseliflavus]|uniref:hypothetical protein n=1 Tax=Enterococcus casseliflavus TaxID=37734 RepID=UPI003D6B32BC